MRKLKLQVQMTLDGFVAGPNGEMNWAVQDWDDDLKKYVGAITEPVDCIILGRKLAQGFIPYWASHPQEEGADFFNDTRKVVFTKTLETSKWDNAVLAKGNLEHEINELKQQEGKDIITYGGATFLAALIEYALIDEFYLFINPIAIGIGLSIFKEPDFKQNLRLVESKPFDCGIVLHKYQLQDMLKG